MEIKEFNQQFIQPNLPKNKKEWLVFTCIIIVVVTLGIVSVNKYLGIQYKATLILSPCNLCDNYLTSVRYGNNNIDFNNLKINYNNSQP